MALRDYAEVTVQGGAKHRVKVTRHGGELEVKGIEAPAGRGSTQSDFITVSVLAMNKQPVEEHFFARSQVVSIVQGNEPLKALKVTKS